MKNSVVSIPISQCNNILPVVTELYQNYPNSFNPTTTIMFDLYEDSFESLKIYNIKGEIVRTHLQDNLNTNYHSVIWNSESDDGKLAASEIYFYELHTEHQRFTNKMLMMK